jgi:hypothetical protein
VTHTILMLGTLAALAAAAVLVFAFALCRASARSDETVRQMVAERDTDRPCASCGLPTGWAWFGRPLCPGCRRHQIEEAE